MICTLDRGIFLVHRSGQCWPVIGSFSPNCTSTGLSWNDRSALSSSCWVSWSRKLLKSFNGRFRLSRSLNGPWYCWPSLLDIFRDPDARCPIDQARILLYRFMSRKRELVTIRRVHETVRYALRDQPKVPPTTS